MKKKIIPIVLLIMAVIVIYSVGNVRRKDTQQKDASSESVSQTEDGRSGDLSSSEEKELMDIVAADQKKAEEGNIFPMGDYQVFGGFGYKVLDFHMYDSYEELVQNVEGYDVKNERLSPNDEGTDIYSYAYVKIQITNDAVAAKRKYQRAPGILLAPNGNAVIDSKPDFMFDSGGEPFYVAGGGDREMKPGETITLQWAFECCYYDAATGGHYRIEDVTSSTEYYLELEGEMTSEYYPHKLKDNKYCIYFKCEPQKGEQEGEKSK